MSREMPGEFRSAGPSSQKVCRAGTMIALPPRHVQIILIPTEGPYTGRCSRQDQQSSKRESSAAAVTLSNADATAPCISNSPPLGYASLPCCICVG
jgi:hypothetical protein